ncbi:deubiquitinating enzyme, partial [Scheffersomyces stipitis CBS 6054]
VSIKNAGKVYDIELEADATGIDFKQKIQELTSIPPNRQKILVKGGKVNDTDNVSAIVASAKQPIMVLGTPDKNLPSKPIEKQVFLEDLNSNQLTNVSNDPSGLVNLGNTCYLNSSLQTLFKIEDVNKKVSSYQAGRSSGVSPTNALVVGLKSLVGQMSKKQEKVNPTLFLALFRNQFPQFAERDNHGFYKQQDAEEAFSQILRVLCDELKIEDSFRLTFNTDTKCLALPEEEHVFGVEESLKLNCHIDIKTNFLRDGLLAGLKDTMEKYNDTLQSNAEYEVSKKITRLPKYLTVHFVRFFWRRDTQKKSKILRRVQFPFELDLSEMLDDSIKSDKVSIRDQLRKIEKDNLDLIRDFKKAKKDTTLNPLEQQEEDEMKLLSIKSKFSDSFKSILPEGFNVEETSENPSSVYELSAVITHAGSSADSGHYQSFIKDDSDLDGERWWKFNDDKVSSVNKEKIESLAGGGESDSALILIYKGLGL